MKNLLSSNLPKRCKDYLYFRIKVVVSLVIPVIVVNTLIDTAQASSSLDVYAQQQAESDPVTTALGCLGLLIILGGLILRWTYGSFAPTYHQTLKSHLSVDQVWAEVEIIFPKRAMSGQPWARKRMKEDPHTLHLSAYPLPNWLGCLAMLLTGILLGGIGWALMGRLEKVVVRPLKTGQTSTVQIGASGYGAVVKVKVLEAVLAADLA